MIKLRGGWENLRTFLKEVFFEKSSGLFTEKKALLGVSQTSQSCFALVKDKIYGNEVASFAVSWPIMESCCIVNVRDEKPGWLRTCLLFSVRGSVIWRFQGLSVWRVGTVGLRRFNQFGRRIDPGQETKTIVWNPGRVWKEGMDTMGSSKWRFDRYITDHIEKVFRSLAHQRSLCMIL